jgi:two-component system OmpR family response regulator
MGRSRGVARGRPTDKSMAPNDPTSILIVDDAPDVRAILREFLELEGYRVSEARDGNEMRAHLDRHPVSLITLDINLPGQDGFALAREIRATRNIPIVMISGKQDPVDRVVALELGADDFVTKPFHLREVLARVRAVLRRYKIDEVTSNAANTFGCNDTVSFEGYTLSRSRRELADTTGRVVELTAAEFNLLDLFLSNPARVMSRDQIMDRLKGNDWLPFDRSIDTLVARLRKKIEGDTDHPKLIKTVRGVGYVFTVEVRKPDRS